MRSLRVLPLVIVAAALLLALKALSFVVGDGMPAAAPVPQVSASHPDPAYRPVVAARLDDGAPAAGIDPHAAHDDTLVPPLDPATTGSVTSDGHAAPSTVAAGDAASAPQASSPPAAAGSPAAPATVPAPDGPAGAPDQGLAASPTETKLLDDLRARQSALKEKASQIDLRSALVQAAEKRLQQQVDVLKAVHGGGDDEAGLPDAAKRMDALVAFYNGMRAKDAANIFNRLDTSVLMKIATRMKPRQFSEILGQMDPAAAERLTLALAGHGPGSGNAALDALPKIQGNRVVTP